MENRASFLDFSSEQPQLSRGCTEVDEGKDQMYLSPYSTSNSLLGCKSVTNTSDLQPKKSLLNVLNFRKTALIFRRKKKGGVGADSWDSITFHQKEPQNGAKKDQMITSYPKTF